MPNLRTRRQLTNSTPRANAARRGLRGARTPGKSYRGQYYDARDRKIGWPIGTQLNKRFIENSPLASYDTRTLHWANVSDIPKLDATHVLNSRERDVVNVAGVKIFIELRNLDGGPLWYRWAVVSCIGFEVPDEAEFFRGDYSTSRAMDFGTNRTSLEFNEAPINTDDYIIHASGKVQLAAMTDASGNFQDETYDSYTMVKKYIPINRQLRFNGENLAHERLWFVFWADKVMQPAGSVAVAARWQQLLRHEIFFSEQTNK